MSRPYLITVSGNLMQTAIRNGIAYMAVFRRIVLEISLLTPAETFRLSGIAGHSPPEEMTSGSCTAMRKATVCGVGHMEAAGAIKDTQLT